MLVTTASSHLSSRLIASLSLSLSLQVLVGLMHKIYSMDRHVETFFIHFNRHYADALATDFGDLSLQQQVAYVRLLYKVHVYVVMYSDCYMYMYIANFSLFMRKFVPIHHTVQWTI